MKFLAEVELVNTLKHALKEKYSLSGAEIFTEVSLGHGIADMVISNLKEIEGLISTDNLLDYFDINVYNLIKKTEAISEKDLFNITRASRQKINASIRKLIEAGYIRVENSILKMNKDYVLLFNCNFAIEAKLKDWKRALKQAYRYRWFADYAYVVIDEQHGKRAIENINLFKKYNVGLATISTSGKLKRHFKPPKQKPFDKKMQILFSEQIKHHYEFAK